MSSVSVVMFLYYDTKNNNNNKTQHCSQCLDRSRSLGEVAQVEAPDRGGGSCVLETMFPIIIIIKTRFLVSLVGSAPCRRSRWNSSFEPVNGAQRRLHVGSGSEPSTQRNHPLLKKKPSCLEQWRSTGGFTPRVAQQTPNLHAFKSSHRSP